MSILMQLVVSGMAVGMIYGVIAFGYQLTFATSKTLNFGQGEALMLGALVGLTAINFLIGQSLGTFWAYLLMLPIVLAFVDYQRNSLGVDTSSTAYRAGSRTTQIALALAPIGGAAAGLFFQRLSGLPSNFACLACRYPGNWCSRNRRHDIGRRIPSTSVFFRPDLSG